MAGKFPRSYSRKKVTPSISEFDRLLSDSDLQNTHHPVAAKTAGHIGKWGMTSFTSLRCINETLAKDHHLKNWNDSSKSFENNHTISSQPKKRKFFKSRDPVDENVETKPEIKPTHNIANTLPTFSSRVNEKEKVINSTIKSSQISSVRKSTDSQSSPKLGGGIKLKIFKSRNHDFESEYSSSVQLPSDDCGSISSNDSSRPVSPKNETPLLISPQINTSYQQPYQFSPKKTPKKTPKKSKILCSEAENIDLNTKEVKLPLKRTRTLQPKVLNKSKSVSHKNENANKRETKSRRCKNNLSPSYEELSCDVFETDIEEIIPAKKSKISSVPESLTEISESKQHGLGRRPRKCKSISSSISMDLENYDSSEVLETDIINKVSNKCKLGMKKSRKPKRIAKKIKSPRGRKLNIKKVEVENLTENSKNEAPQTNDNQDIAKNINAQDFTETKEKHITEGNDVNHVTSSDIKNEGNHEELKDTKLISPELGDQKQHETADKINAPVLAVTENIIDEVKADISYKGSNELFTTESFQEALIDVNKDSEKMEPNIQLTDDIKTVPDFKIKLNTANEVDAVDSKDNTDLALQKVKEVPKKKLTIIKRNNDTNKTFHSKNKSIIETLPKPVKIEDKSSENDRCPKSSEKSDFDSNAKLESLKESKISEDSKDLIKSEKINSVTVVTSSGAKDLKSTTKNVSNLQDKSCNNDEMPKNGDHLSVKEIKTSKVLGSESSKKELKNEDLSSQNAYDKDEMPKTVDYSCTKENESIKVLESKSPKNELKDQDLPSSNSLPKIPKTYSKKVNKPIQGSVSSKRYKTVDDIADRLFKKSKSFDTKLTSGPEVKENSSDNLTSHSTINSISNKEHEADKQYVDNLEVESTLIESKSIPIMVTQSTTSTGVNKKKSIFKSRQKDDGSKSKRATYTHKWHFNEEEEFNDPKSSEQNSSSQPTKLPSNADDFDFEPGLTRVQSMPTSIYGLNEFEENKSVVSIKCPKNSKAYYQPIKNVKTIYQLQESGEFQEFNDDIEYFLESLKSSNAISTRCLASINLAQKCMIAAFRMHLRMDGTVIKFFNALSDAPSNAHLAECAAIVMFSLSQDRLTMDLDKNSLELMLNLLDTEDSSYSSTSDHNVKITALCIELQQKGLAKHLKLNKITAAELAMETLLSLTSKRAGESRAGEWFKEELRNLGGVDHLVRTVISCSDSFCSFGQNFSQALLDKISKIDRCLKVIENITNQNTKNQEYVMKADGEKFPLTLVKIFKLCKDEIKLHPENPTSCVGVKHDPIISKILVTTLLTTLKVFVNLTHGYEKESLGSKVLGSKSEVYEYGLYSLLMMPTYLNVETKFEMQMLVCCLFLNLVENSTENRKTLMKISSPVFDPNESDLNIFKKKEPEKAICSLITLFYSCEESAKEQEAHTNQIIDKDLIQDSQDDNKETNKNEKDEDMNEVVSRLLQKAGRHMEDTLIAAYTALIAGYCIKESKEYENEIRLLQPDNNFKTLVTILKKFLHFMNMTATTSLLRRLKPAEAVVLYMQELDRSPEELKEIERKNKEKEEAAQAMAMDSFGF